MSAVVEVHRDPAALRALVPQWEELAAAAIEPNPFFEHWMLLPALEAYGAQDFRCVAVWEDGKLQALFPLRIEPRFRGLPLRAARSWRHRNMLLGTPLLREKHAAQCIAALLQSRVAPVVEFDWLPAGGAFYGALAEAAAADGGSPWLVTEAYARAVLDRERDPRPRFNSNMRNNLKRSQARLAAQGELRPVRLAPGDDVAAWTEEFIRLEASGWKGRAGSALGCREDDRRFAAAAFAEAHRRGKLLITGLDLGGKPLARHVMFVGGDTAYTFKIAYDEAHAAASPGILAEADNVRQFMDTPGLRALDSNTARGSENYGRVWRNFRTFQRVALGAHGLGRAAVAALPLVRLAREAVRSAAGKIRSGRRIDPAVRSPNMEPTRE